jgi:integrase
MAVRRRTNKKGVVWQIDYYDPQGKRTRKDFKLKKDAEAYLGKVLASMKEGRYQDVFDVKKESQITFGELADMYEENFQTQKSFQGFKSHVVRDLRADFGGKRLAEITYLDLETYRNRRKATPTKAGNPRKDASVNRDMAILGHMLSKAVEWGLLETSPFKKGKRLMFKENNQRLRFLSDAEIEALLAVCPDHLKPVVEVAILTGMRRGELLSLKWEQIRNELIYLTETKSGKARQIPINDRLAMVFKEIRKENQLKSAYVFCDSQGRRFYEVKRSFTTACKKAGVADFRFHDLRHTFASHLVMNGVNLKAVQELLGHADLTMTMRYAHLSQAHLQDAVAKINEIGYGHKLVTDSRQNKKADSLTSANLL